MKVDEEDVPPGTVLRDLKQIDSTLEPALSGQRSSDVPQPDRPYRSYHDVAVTHAIATSYFHVTALPDPHRAPNLAAADSVAELFRENHAGTLPKKSGLVGGS